MHPTLTPFFTGVGVANALCAFFLYISGIDHGGFANALALGALVQLPLAQHLGTILNKLGGRKVDPKD